MCSCHSPGVSSRPSSPSMVRDTVKFRGETSAGKRDRVHSRRRLKGLGRGCGRVSAKGLRVVDTTPGRSRESGDDRSRFLWCRESTIHESVHNPPVPRTVSHIHLSCSSLVCSHMYPRFLGGRIREKTPGRRQKVEGGRRVTPMYVRTSNKVLYRYYVFQCDRNPTVIR